MWPPGCQLAAYSCTVALAAVGMLQRARFTSLPWLSTPRTGARHYVGVTRLRSPPVHAAWAGWRLGGGGSGWRRLLVRREIVGLGRKGGYATQAHPSASESHAAALSQTGWRQVLLKLSGCV
eukprot:COSAG01_NODE_7316_length_3255_cov_2.297212_1_plen_122_part_00